MTSQLDFKSSFFMIGFLSVVSLASSSASATVITFTHTGISGSGSLGGNSFTSLPFTFTATGDTLNREEDAPNSVFSIDHITSSISIGGLGVFTIINPTRTFFNDAVNIVGFSRGGLMGSDLYNGPTSPLLSGWDMLTSIGPINGGVELIQWNFSPIITSAGQLIFNDGLSIGTFQAVVGPTSTVPEPISMAIFGCLILSGLVGYRPHRLG